MKKVTGRKRYNHTIRPHRRRRSARLRASNIIDDDQESSENPETELEIINLEDGTGRQSCCPGSVPNQITLSANSSVQDESPLEVEPLLHFSPFQPVSTPAEDRTTNLIITNEWENIDHDFLSESLSWPEDNIVEDDSSLSSGPRGTSWENGEITQQEKIKQPSRIVQTEKPSQAHIIRALTLQWTFACGFLCPEKRSPFSILKPPTQYLRVARRTPW